jgi:hypothetical protein
VWSSLEKKEKQKPNSFFLFFGRSLGTTMTDHGHAWLGLSRVVCRGSSLEKKEKTKTKFFFFIFGRRLGTTMTMTDRMVGESSGWLSGAKSRSLLSSQGQAI